MILNDNALNAADAGAEETNVQARGEKELFEYSPESMVEYSVRRKIATKVLGAKMLQGYSLLEKQCDKCGMPRMSHGGEMVDCVVCPVLARKAKKQLKAQKQLEEETIRVEQKVASEKKKLDAMKAEANLANVEEHREPAEDKAQHEERTEITEQTEQEQRFTEQEALMLATLEEEAAAKAKAAAEALRKAKAALVHVSSIERGMISHTIAQAEKEFPSDGEKDIEGPSEDHIEQTIQASSSYINQVDWHKLRADGRATMTRRIMAGWLVLNDFCEGSECYHMALITKGGQKECVVCGGTGCGTDGAYSPTKHFAVFGGHDTILDDGFEIVKRSGSAITTEAEEPSIAAPLPVAKEVAEPFPVAEEVTEEKEVKAKDISKPDPSSVETSIALPASDGGATEKSRELSSASPRVDPPAALQVTASLEGDMEEKPAPKTFTFETPEEMPISRPPRASPRPSPRGLPPRSTPRSRKNGGVVIVGGPADFDNKSYGDMSRLSRAESVASEALDTILDQIERSKTKLANEDLSLTDQLAAANLIEKLAGAAVAMKKLEKFDV